MFRPSIKPPSVSSCKPPVVRPAQRSISTRNQVLFRPQLGLNKNEGKGGERITTKKGDMDPSFETQKKKVEQQASNSKEVDAKQGAQNAQKVEVANFKIDPNKPFEEAGPTNQDKPLNSDREEVVKTEARNTTTDVFKANVVK